MANTITTTYQINGSRIFSAKVDISGDGSGEAAAVDIITPAGLTGTPSKFKITEIQWSLPGFVAELVWDATSDVLAIALDGNGGIKFSETGQHLINNAGAGVTGKLQLTTIGLVAGEKGTIFIKGIH